MSEHRMDVILLNTPQPGIDRGALIGNLAAAFKKDSSAISKMLSQPRTRIKKGVEEGLAKKYKNIIETAGGQCELVSHSELPVAVHDEQPSPESPSTAQIQEQPEQLCPKCDAMMQAGIHTCLEVLVPQTQPATKNKVTAGLLALFFGGFGVHRFYLGQWWGIFYIIFWFTLIPSIVSVVEAVIFFLAPDNRWQKKYSRTPEFSGGMVAAVVASIFVFVMLIGMLTAIAVPAYQDYTLRVKIASAMPLVDQSRKQVAAFIKKTDSLPEQNSEAGLPEVISSEFVSSIQLQEDAMLEVTFNISVSPDNSNTIIWVPTRLDDEILWSCKGGTLAERYRPRECRDGVTELSAQDGSKQSARLSKRLFSTDQHLSLNVPEGWSVHSELSADASISVANTREATYALVIKEPKLDFAADFSLSEYTNVIVSLMKENIKDGRTPGKLRQFTINGFPAEQLILMGSVDKINIGYVLTTVESEHGFYQVVAWTLASRLKEDHPLLRSIGKSLVVHRDFDGVVAEI